MINKNIFHLPHAGSREMTKTVSAIISAHLIARWEIEILFVRYFRPQNWISSPYIVGGLHNTQISNNFRKILQAAYTVKNDTRPSMN